METHFLLSRMMLNYFLTLIYRFQSWIKIISVMPANRIHK